MAKEVLSSYANNWPNVGPVLTPKGVDILASDPATPMRQNYLQWKEELDKSVEKSSQELELSIWKAFSEPSHANKTNAIHRLRQNCTLSWLLGKKDGPWMFGTMIPALQRCLVICHIFQFENVTMPHGGISLWLAGLSLILSCYGFVTRTAILLKTLMNTPYGRRSGANHDTIPEMYDDWFMDCFRHNQDISGIQNIPFIV